MRKRLISRLEKRCDTPVLVVGASWRADIATDLDGQAARAVADLLDEVRGDELTIVYVARGGEVGFADAVARSLRAREVRFRLAVPTLVNGAGALLAMAATKILVHPHGAVGAYDAGPMRARHARLQPSIFDDVPALGGIRYEHDVALPARLGAGMRERRLARALAERVAPAEANYDALSHLRLGDSLGLDARELRAAGFDAETWDEPALWSLFRSVEHDLGLLDTPQPRYTEADLGDEVEFAEAMGLLGALVATRDRALRYELDTGSPDPDTGIYAGAWGW